MKHGDDLASLVEQERQVRLPREDFERYRRRLQGSVHLGRKAMPLAATELTLGLASWTAKAAAGLAAVGLVSAASAVAWVSQREPRPTEPTSTESTARSPAPHSSQSGLERRANEGNQAAHAAFVEANPVREEPATRSHPGPTLPAKVAAPSGPSREEGRPGRFSDEVQLIRSAKLALDRGEPTLARQWLDQHGRRFPDGVFAAERDALRVVIDCSEDASTAGRRAAQRFLSTYPGSIHRDRIVRACGLRPSGAPDASVSLDEK
jgi:hypothetical protein